MSFVAYADAGYVPVALFVYASYTCGVVGLRSGIYPILREISQSKVVPTIVLPVTVAVIQLNGTRIFSVNP
jgi:hypothetical protein